MEELCQETQRDTRNYAGRRGIKMKVKELKEKISNCGEEEEIYLQCNNWTVYTVVDVRSLNDYRDDNSSFFTLMATQEVKKFPSILVP